jgi:4-hydroxyphenylpyruvate dioxygenase
MPEKGRVPFWKNARLYGKGNKKMRHPGFKSCIATVSIAGGFREKLGAIAEAGYDGIEIFEQDFIAYDGSPAEVGRMVADQGLEIMLFQPFRDFEGLPEPQRSRAFDRAEQKFDLMNQLGVDLMLVCSSISPHGLGGIDRAADDFAELGERAAKKGIRVGYEGLAWGRHIHDHRDVWEVVRRADHPNIGIILDSFHSLARKIDSASIRSIPADKIFFVQLADAPLIDMDLLYWSRHFRNMPGEGDLPVTDFMRAVAATGYDGPVSLEIFNDLFRGGSPWTIARDGWRSLVNLMDNVQRSEPQAAWRLPDIPARQAASGVGFIEFTADATEAEKLGGLLASLGFVHTGQHISKQVQLWRQGDIQILINTEEDSHAHSARLLHGTSVCDIGLWVADAHQTAERAVALGADMFRQPTLETELQIPAVKGVGSGVMHFLDSGSDLARIWEVDFNEHRPLQPADGAGLVHIDHLAQTMKYEEMLSWTLFYTSLFETGKVAMVDVVDPAGLVRSQAIENQDGSLRITLNGAESQNTLAGHFVAQTTGSTVQHIAFASEDIFATADRLADKGFSALVLSPNYWDDLEARFGLEAEFLARLRARQILYDRDESGGEFFQLYSQNWGAGMFFEITQRSGGYNGYGAANAPFRISAQKRDWQG